MNHTHTSLVPTLEGFARTLNNSFKLLLTEQPEKFRLHRK